MKTMIKMLRPEDIWQPKLGAPRGNRNALKTGRYTADKRALRRQLAAFIRNALAVAVMVEARIESQNGGKDAG